MAVITKKLDIKFLYVTEILANKVFLEWVYEITPGAALNIFQITIQRSRNKEFNFVDISTPFSANASTRYYDYTLDLYSNWEDIFYRLKIFDTSNNQCYFTDSYSFVGKPDNLLLEIRRRNEILLEEFISPRNRWGGVNAAIYLKKQYGEHCTECFDKILKKVTKSKCPVCLGTGWLQGYEGPFFRAVNFSNTVKQNFISELGKEEPGQNSSWMSCDPILKPADIIIELNENRRWRVVRIQTTQKLRQISRQILELDLLDRKSSEHELIEIPTLRGEVDFFPDLPDASRGIFEGNYYKVLNDGSFEFPYDILHGRKGIYRFESGTWVYFGN